MRTLNGKAVAAALLLTLGSFNTLHTTAAERPAAERTGRGQMLEKIREKLQLNDEQVSQIKAELAVEKETLKGLVVRLHQARVGLREAIGSKNASEASVRVAAAKISAVQSDLAVERFKLYGRIHPILTEEQREKVKQFESQLDELIQGALNRLVDRWQNK